MADWLPNPRTTFRPKLMADMTFAPVERHSDSHQPKGARSLGEGWNDKASQSADVISVLPKLSRGLSIKRSHAVLSGT